MVRDSFYWIVHQGEESAPFGHARLNVAFRNFGDIFVDQRREDERWTIFGLSSLFYSSTFVRRPPNLGNISRPDLSVLDSYWAAQSMPLQIEFSISAILQVRLRPGASVSASQTGHITYGPTRAPG
eukprot:248234_1